jgi:hypothetical protein
MISDVSEQSPVDNSYARSYAISVRRTVYNHRSTSRMQCLYVVHVHCTAYRRGFQAPQITGRECVSKKEYVAKWKERNANGLFVICRVPRCLAWPILLEHSHSTFVLCERSSSRCGDWDARCRSPSDSWSKCHSAFPHLTIKELHLTRAVRCRRAARCCVELITCTLLISVETLTQNLPAEY